MAPGAAARTLGDVTIGDLPHDWTTKAFRTADPLEVANWFSRLGFDLESGSQPEELHIARGTVHGEPAHAYVLRDGQVVVRRDSVLDSILSEQVRRGAR